MNFADPKKIDDPQAFDGLKVISNESMDLNDPKEFDDPQVFDDPKGISIGSMNFDNPKSMMIPPSSMVYGDISIFDGLVLFRIFLEIFHTLVGLHLCR